MIQEEEVRHIAKLARLELTEKEVEKFQKELSSILDYIEKLKEVDILKVDSTSHAILVENVKRKDAFFNTELEKKKKITKLAPEFKDGHIKVKSILK